MANAKYGRLFTKMDLKLVAAEAAVQMVRRLNRLGEARYSDPPSKQEMLDIIESAIAIEDADSALTFPPDEPLFLLRGQDKAAPRAIADDVDGEADYLRVAGAFGASEEYLRAVERAARAMRDWQAEHPDRVKRPD